MISTPTRGDNILDLLFTTNPSAIPVISILDPIHDLDHLPIYAETSDKTFVPKSYTRHIWSYDKGDFTMLRNSLESTDWNHLLDPDVDVDTLVERFNDRLTSLCGVYVPNRVVKISPKDKPGMDKHC